MNTFETTPPPLFPGQLNSITNTQLINDSTRLATSSSCSLNNILPVDSLLLPSVAHVVSYFPSFMIIPNSAVHLLEFQWWPTNYLYLQPTTTVATWHETNHVPVQAPIKHAVRHRTFRVLSTPAVNDVLVSRSSSLLVGWAPHRANLFFAVFLFIFSRRLFVGRPEGSLAGLMTVSSLLRWPYKLSWCLGALWSASRIRIFTLINAQTGSC